MPSRRDMRARGGGEGSRGSSRPSGTGPRYRGGAGSHYDPPSSSGGFSGGHRGFSGGYRGFSGGHRPPRPPRRGGNAGCSVVVLIIIFVVIGIYFFNKANGG